MMFKLFFNLVNNIFVLFNMLPLTPIKKIDDFIFFNLIS